MASKERTRLPLNQIFARRWPVENGHRVENRKAHVRNDDILLNRTRAGKRWTREDDERLIALAAAGHSAIVLASVLKRSYSSVQNRLRSLSNNTRDISRKEKAKSQPFRRKDRKPNLSCGAISASGREVIELLWSNIKTDRGILKRNEPSRLKPEVERIMGAIIRETVGRSDTSLVWTRVAVSRRRAEEIGVDHGVLRNLLRALIKEKFLEVFVGYVGFAAVLRLERGAAKLGRPSLLRASSRLIGLCGMRGITRTNVYGHFPEIG